MEGAYVEGTSDLAKSNRIREMARNILLRTFNQGLVSVGGLQLQLASDERQVRGKDF
jgi:hypothetical protein